MRKNLPTKGGNQSKTIVDNFTFNNGMAMIPIIEKTYKFVL